MEMRRRVFRDTALFSYVALILTLGAGLILWGWVRADASAAPFSLAVFGFWFVMSLAAECFWLETPTGAGMVSMSLAVNMATFFTLPFEQVLMVGAFSVALSDVLIHRRGGLRACFNGAQTAISMAASLGVFQLLGGPSYPTGSQVFLQHPLPVLTAPVIFFVVNTFLVAAVISLYSDLPLWRVWRENYGFSYQFLSSGTLFLLGVSLVIATESIGWVSGLLYLLLFYFVRDGYRRFVRDRARKPA